MTIEILTVLPELLTSPFEHSIMKRAQERGHLHIKLHQLRKWAINKHGQVDDYQYGGGAGMVIMCAPLANAIDELQQEGKFDEIIFPNKLINPVSMNYTGFHWKNLYKKWEHFIRRNSHFYAINSQNKSTSSAIPHSQSLLNFLLLSIFSLSISHQISSY